MSTFNFFLYIVLICVAQRQLALSLPVYGSRAELSTTLEPNEPSLNTPVSPQAKHPTQESPKHDGIIPIFMPSNDASPNAVSIITICIGILALLITFASLVVAVAGYLDRRLNTASEQHHQSILEAVPLRTLPSHDDHDALRA